MSAFMSWGAGEEVGWEDTLERGVVIGDRVEVALTEGACGCVGNTAKDLEGEEVALSVAFAAEEEVGRGSRVGAAVRVAEEVPDALPGVSVGKAEVEEEGEAPGVVEGTLGAL